MRRTCSDILQYFLLIWKCGSELILSPESIATVEEGRPLTLTCQSNETSGIYSFFYIDDHGNKIQYGNGGGSFLSCMNSTSQAFMACEFGDHWIFRLTITHPFHNQTVYCSGVQTSQEWLTSTTIFVEGDTTLSVTSSSNVVVNQTITLQCLFRSGQLGVQFSFPGRISCLVAFDSCARSCGSLLSIECPNNQTYILNVTVLPSWHKTTFSCQPPFGGIRSEITLNVTVPVTSAIISTNQTSLDSGTIMSLTCQTSYCHPPANVTWYNDNIAISDHTIVTIDTNQYFLSRMTSKLQYTVLPQDNGQNIYCIASNIQGERVVSDKITLDVRYISDVYIIPSGNLHVVAGTKQVWIHCYAENANPEVIEYIWFKGNSSNLTDLSHSQTLVFKTVDIQDSSQYTCRATNVAGTSTGTIQVIVQYAPLAAKIIQVICQDTRAFILWTSPNTYSSDDTFKEIPQYKRSNDVLFETLEKPNWNGTNNNIKLIEVTNLKPNTEYLFSVLTLSRLGSAYSNNETCITDTETAEKIIGDCNTQIAVAIGGLLCAFVFFCGLIVTGAIYYKKAKERKQTVAAGTPKITATYEDQFCERKDHHYDGILPTPSTTDNIEMYSSVQLTGYLNKIRDT